MHTLDSALTIIRVIEPELASIGYHTALTGSVLYRGESHKDTDVIVYPHDPAKTKPTDEIVAALTRVGFSLRFETDKEYVNREVLLCGYQDRRVDIFVF